MVQRAHLFYNNAPAAILAPAVRTADANGTSIDLQGFNQCLLIGHVGTAGDTLSGSVKIELEVEESDDNSTFTDVANSDLTAYVTGSSTGTFASVQASGSVGVFMTAYRGTKRYVRVVYNITGTHTNGTPANVIAIKGSPHILPQNTNT